MAIYFYIQIGYPFIVVSDFMLEGDGLVFI